MHLGSLVCGYFSFMQDLSNVIETLQEQQARSRSRSRTGMRHTELIIPTHTELILQTHGRGEGQE